MFHKGTVSGTAEVSEAVVCHVFLGQIAYFLHHSKTEHLSITVLHPSMPMLPPDLVTVRDRHCIALQPVLAPGGSPA